MFLISPAYAQAAAGANSLQSQLMGFAPLVLIVGVFYFLLIRPQQQKAKELRVAQSALRRGDKVVTAGGIIGSVARVINDDEVEVQIAEGVKVRVLRATISTVLTKGEPAKSEPAKGEPASVSADDTSAEAEAPPTVKKRRTAAPK